MISKEAERIKNLESFERIHSLGLSFVDAFDEEDEIIIYGFGTLGRKLLLELLSKRNVVGIIDNAIWDGEYCNIPIFHIFSEEITTFLKQFCNLKIVVTPTYNWEETLEDISNVVSDVEIVPFCAICALLEVKKYIIDKGEKELLLRMVMCKEETSISKIHLVDGLHGFIIYLMYHQGCQDTLFLMQTYKPEKELLDMITKLGGVMLCIGDTGENGKYIDDAKFDVVRAMKYYVNKYQIEVYGQDFFPYVLDFLECNLTLIEDGFVSEYSVKEFKKGFPGIYYALQGEVCFAHYDEVQKVIFIKDYGISNEYKEKSVIINLKEIWRGLSEELKNTIKEGFCFSEEVEKEIIKENRKILVIGSNFSGNMLCTENVEIKMFEEMLSHYKEEDIVFKPHPMSKIDFKSIFPESYVIETKFPIELLMFCDIGIERIVGIASNGIECLREIYVIDEYPELKQKYIEAV